MGVIMHNNIPYGGGSTIEPNPQESATEQLETLGIDGDVYEVTDANAIHTSDVGVANGVAELDANGFVPSSQLPSYVDDVLEYASRSAFPATGETGKIYVALDTNLTYRWGGSDYVEISPSLALGETSSTAYRGDRGKIAYDHSQSDHSGIKPAFTEASTRANIASGETIATIFGKIKKFFSDLKTVAFSGSYNDLTNKPTIPAAQVNSDWDASSGVAQILHKPALATVATSGSYNDLSNKPTIPTVNNGTLTIQKNGTQVATFSANQSGNATANITVPTGDLASINKDGTSSTKYLRGDGTWQTFPTIPTVNNATLTIQKNGIAVETFTANSSTNKTANITVPTKVSELTNDSGYTTNTGTVTQVKVGTTAYNPSSGVISLPAYPSDTNTHRPIQMNGTEILGNNTTALNLKAGSNVTLTNSSGTVTIAATDNDTKNTAGTTNTTSKIYLAGATSQAANPQTYSNANCYAYGNYLYSGSNRVATLNGTEDLTNKTYNGYTLAAACAKAVQDSSSATSLTDTSLPTGRTISSFINSKKYVYSGTGSYISTFTIEWFMLGYLCVFSISFKTNVNISNSTGWTDIKNANFPTPNQTLATANVGESAANNQIRSMQIMANGTYRAFRAVGPYVSGTAYYASGAFIIS